MKKTDSPALFPEVFARDADARLLHYPLPSTSQTTGRASLLQGFPAENFTPLSAGGTPVNGADTQSLFKMLSVAAKASEAGQIRPYNAAYAQTIGGYPQGAFVAEMSQPSLCYLSLCDDNLTDPALDTQQKDHPASWVRLDFAALSLGSSESADPLKGMTITQTGDTVSGYRTRVPLIAASRAVNGAPSALDAPPLQAVATTYDTVSPDFWAQEEARLQTRLTQAVTYRTIRQQSAIGQQQFVLMQQKAAALGISS